MGLVNAAAQAMLGKLATLDPTNMPSLRAITLAVLVGVAGLWGAVDGWRRRGGRGMTWFYASLVGGELAGLLGIIGQAAFVDQTGIWALGPALTVSAAFSALLILLPAGLGLAVGSKILASPGQVAPDSEPGDADSAVDARVAGRRRLAR